MTVYAPIDVGRTGRGGPNNRSPIRHVMTRFPYAKVRDTGSRLALCGANLRGVLIGTALDSEDPRTCRACLRILENRRRP